MSRFVWLVLALGCTPGARAASAGASHSCVVLVGGKIKCWGENFWGQVGQSDNLVRGDDASDMGDSLPYVPLGEFEASLVASGSEFSCALAVDGAVKCWGRNSSGQLGLGDNETRGGQDDAFEMGDKLPVLDLGTGVAVESIALAGSHACAVLADGKLKCWGENEGGQLGLGDTLTRGNATGQMGDNLPFVDLGDEVLVSSVALGAKHTCAVVGDGDVKCWGNNDGGQLGYEDTTARGIAVGQMGDLLPAVDLGTKQRAIAVAAGFFHTCALLYTGDIKCWGFGSSGQLGQGSNSSIGNAVDSMGDNFGPVDLGADRTAIAVSLGGTHSCAALDDSTVKCWGGNGVGSLGLGDSLNRGLDPGEMGDNLPTVGLSFGPGLGAASNVFAGRFHTCVSGAEGDLACFGLNSGGQLGSGSDENNIGDEPGEVKELTSINLGAGEVVSVPDAPGLGVALEATGDDDSEGAGDTFSSSTVIVFASAAALVFALVAGALLWCLCRRKRQQRTPSTAAAAAGDNIEGATGNAEASAQPRNAASAGETGGGSTSGDGGSDSAHPTQDIATARATSSTGPLRPSPPPESGDSENRPGGEDPTPHHQ